MSELIECGLKVTVCGKSLDEYNISDTEMIEEVERSSMKTLAALVKTSDHVLTF